MDGKPRGAGAPPPKSKAKSSAPKPKARPKKRVKRESPPPEPVEEAEPLPPAPADNEVAEGAALAPRAFREKLSKALDKLGGRYNLETSPGVRGNLQPAVQVCASGQRDAYGAVLRWWSQSVWKSKFYGAFSLLDGGAGFAPDSLCPRVYTAPRASARRDLRRRRVWHRHRGAPSGAHDSVRASDGRRGRADAP